MNDAKYASTVVSRRLKADRIMPGMDSILSQGQVNAKTEHVQREFYYSPSRNR